MRYRGNFAILKLDFLLVGIESQDLSLEHIRASSVDGDFIWFVRLKVLNGLNTVGRVFELKLGNRKRGFLVVDLDCTDSSGLSKWDATIYSVPTNWTVRPLQWR